MEKMRLGALRSLLQRCHRVLPDLCLDRVKSHLEYLREPQGHTGILFFKVEGICTVAHS